MQNFSLKINLKIQLFSQTMRNTQKTSECKIVCFSKVYKFSIKSFLIRCIFFYSIKKVPLEIKNPIFQLNYAGYENDVKMQNCFVEKDLKFFIYTFFSL